MQAACQNPRHTPARQWLILTAAVLPLLSTPTSARAATDPASASVCARFGEPEMSGGVASAELLEVSGMAASAAHQGVIWAHNDAGDGPRLFAVGVDGADLGVYSVPGVKNRDWEDIAVGPGPDASRSYIYIGDIGDNKAQRESTTVIRMLEPKKAPDGSGGELDDVVAIELSYPDGPANAEALIVDPLTGDLVVVTSDATGGARILGTGARDLEGAADGTAVVMQDSGSIGLPPDAPDAAADGVVAGTISPDGTIVLLRTPKSVLAYPRGASQTLVDALAGTPCTAPSGNEVNSQAITFTGNGKFYVTAGEVAGAVRDGSLPPGSATPIWSVAVSDEPTGPETDPPATEPTTTQAPVTEPPTTESDNSPTTTFPTPTTVAPSSSVPSAPSSTANEAAASAPPAADAADDQDGEDDSLMIVAVAGAALLVVALLVLLVRRRRKMRRPLPGSAPLAVPATAFPPPSGPPRGAVPDGTMPPPAAEPDSPAEPENPAEPGSPAEPESDDQGEPEA